MKLTDFWFNLGKAESVYYVFPDGKGGEIQFYCSDRYNPLQGTMKLNADDEIAAAMRGNCLYIGVKE